MPQIRRPNYIAKRAPILVANTPYFYGFKMPTGQIGSIQIQWHDATSSFTVTPYTSNVDSPTVPDAAGTADVEEWSDESADLTITGGSASAAGCDLVHVGNNGARWMMLQLDLAANSEISIIIHEKE